MVKAAKNKYSIQHGIGRNCLCEPKPAAQYQCMIKLRKRIAKDVKLMKHLCIMFMHVHKGIESTMLRSALTKTVCRIGAKLLLMKVLEKRRNSVKVFKDTIKSVNALPILGTRYILH